MAIAPNQTLNSSSFKGTLPPYIEPIWDLCDCQSSQHQHCLGLSQWRRKPEDRADSIYLEISVEGGVDMIDNKTKFEPRKNIPENIKTKAICQGRLKSLSDISPQEFITS